MEWAEFLANHGATTSDVAVENAIFHKPGGTGGPRAVAATPDLLMHCNICEGERVFASLHEPDDYIPTEETRDLFLGYACRNCLKELRIFAVALGRTGATTAIAYKYGQKPQFGPPVPPRLIKILGSDWPLFLQGRRCESNGFGVGAFAYYRRVVENQKARLLEAMEGAAKRMGADPILLAQLEEARSMREFKKAVEHVKGVLPTALLVEGEHNPLILLHQAISAGLHEETDEVCLAAARRIRLVLGDTAERIANVTRENKELREAFSSLFRPLAEGEEDEGG